MLDPILRGEYPDGLWKRFGPLGPDIRAGDLKAIAEPLDFLGVNYYTRAVVAASKLVPVLGSKQVRPKGGEYSPMWEIYPAGLGELLERIWNDYRPPMILVTENGVPVMDALGGDGAVHDPARISYLERHLKVLHGILEKNIPVRGYFVWTLMDNFEWSFGYGMRFGMVYTNFASLERTPKDSFRAFAEIIRRNGLEERT
jgi:beta-glucosidase